MAIITVSRGCYSRGKRIAEAVAEKLGYECITREILLEASDEFHVPEIKLARAIHDAPSILERFTHGRERYVSYVRTAFLEHVLKDDVVYHGLAGHFFLTGVAHVLKVRIIADTEDRVRWEMERKRIGEKEARHVLKKDDHERRRWSQALYGIDTADPSSYDLVIHVRKFSVGDAVDMICHASSLPHFQTTPESQENLESLLLAARAKNAIVHKWPTAQVSAEDGLVVVHISAPLITESRVCQEITEMIKVVPGVKEVRTSVRPTGLSHWL